MCGYYCVGFIDYMLAGKTLIDYTSLFLPYDLKAKWQHNFEIFQNWMNLIISKINLNLSNQSQFRLNKIN